MTEAVIIVPAVFLAFVMIVKIISDNRVRKQLIEKGMVQDGIKLMSVNRISEPLSSMKWGLALVAIGAALFIAELLPLYSNEATFGLIFLLVGIAFIAYYFITRRHEEKSSDHDETQL